VLPRRTSASLGPPAQRFELAAGPQRGPGPPSGPTTAHAANAPRESAAFPDRGTVRASVATHQFDRGGSASTLPGGRLSVFDREQTAIGQRSTQVAFVSGEIRSGSPRSASRFLIRSELGPGPRTPRSAQAGSVVLADVEYRGTSARIPLRCDTGQANLVPSPYLILGGFLS
jgi:hypothetical protein